MLRFCTEDFCSRYVILACVLLFGGTSAECSEKRPNVIVILADDQGTLDAGCYGAEDLATPALDRLAATGVRFTQFYSSAPVCSPSRAGLMTGRSPQAAGVPGNVGITAEGMPAAQVTLAEAFHEHGYATAHIGKWHLGHHEETVPNAQGFDFSFGHYVGCIDNYSHFFYWNGPNKHDLWRNNEPVHRPGQFFPDLMLEEAQGFIREEREVPFFMYFAINLPHYPYQGSPEWLQHYAHLPYPRDLYAAFLSTMDEKIGVLLRMLDDEGIRDDTIVVYQSDHGHSTEERAHFGGGYAGPYRGAKFSLHEGGLRVPALISWPGGSVPQGEVRHQLAVACDWYPTLLELAGLPAVKHEIDGRSLVPILNSMAAPDAHQQFHWEQSGQWVVREGQWKLCCNVVDTSGRQRIRHEGTALYNLQRDPSESDDVAGAHPEIVDRLTKAHQVWKKSLRQPD